MMREAEIEQYRASVIKDDDVIGLQVVMDGVLLMQGMHRVGDRCAERNNARFG